MPAPHKLDATVSEAIIGLPKHRVPSRSTAQAQMDQQPPSTPALSFATPDPSSQTKRTSLLQRATSWLGNDIMARVTRSSKLKATPISTPTKTVKAEADPDTPIASVEAPAGKKGGKGPYARKPRKQRQRDLEYKKKKRAQQMELKSEKLKGLKLDSAERKALRAGIHGDSTSEKLSDVVLEQRAEIARLKKKLNGDNKSSEETAATSPNASARAGTGGRRQRTTIA